MTEATTKTNNWIVDHGDKRLEIGTPLVNLDTITRCGVVACLEKAADTIKIHGNLILKNTNSHLHPKTYDIQMLMLRTFTPSPEYLVELTTNPEFLDRVRGSPRQCVYLITGVLEGINVKCSTLGSQNNGMPIWARHLCSCGPLLIPVKIFAYRVRKLKILPLAEGQLGMLRKGGTSWDLDLDATMGKDDWNGLDINMLEVEDDTVEKYMLYAGQGSGNLVQS
ncbi:hypothetical protein BDV25DRAFT_139614 [Aspergillus avenaceus]|uniref:Uncharacterized protein n=1 Tax=Aspergillus avenaceus TaxID=36643 RepID=A0A5N6TW56_ASPAV|nr:hypothetical protein BDV25DRAFT_139614 [Aspergillus avenaceus]